jgi:uncharacterized Zn finger protein (UPF0148 family)
MGVEALKKGGGMKVATCFDCGMPNPMHPSGGIFCPFYNTIVKDPKKMIETCEYTWKPEKTIKDKKDEQPIGIRNFVEHG